MSTTTYVGRNVANIPPKTAVVGKLAKRCQHQTQQNQCFSEMLASWQVGNVANLPTSLSDCFNSFSCPIYVGENSPSYYVGGGPKAPSVLRRGCSAGVLLPSSEERSVLALDLGTTTGWAVLDHYLAISSGSEEFKPHRFEGGGMRFLRFKRWLTELKQSIEGIDLIVFEEVRRHAGVDAAHCYGGFMAHLTAWAEHHGIPYQGVPVGTIKKHATGKGNASKEQMIAAMHARGHDPEDDNEADALALLYWAIESQEV